jgi:hypothetical protein
VESYYMQIGMMKVTSLCPSCCENKVGWGIFNLSRILLTEHSESLLHICLAEWYVTGHFSYESYIREHFSAQWVIKAYFIMDLELLVTISEEEYTCLTKYIVLWKNEGNLKIL